MALEWVRQGHDVTVVASSYSHYRQFQPNIKKRITVETIDGIRYIWVKTHRYAASSSLGRVTNMLSFTAQCMWLPLPIAEAFDLIICSSPHPFVIYPGHKLARRFNSRLIYDIRDLWPLTPKLLGNISPKHPFIRLLQHAEDYACKYADLVISVPQNAKEYLASRGLPQERFLHIANGAILDTGEENSLPDSHIKILEDIRSRAKYIIGYVGTLGTANAMADLLYALVDIKDDIHLAILGNGSEREKLTLLKEHLGLDGRVHFLNPVLKSQVPSFLKHIDIGYAGTNNSPLYKYGASLTKINDYMLAGIPIVYSVGDPENAVEVSGAGVSCSAGDPAAITAAIHKLVAESKEELKERGQRGREWCIENQLISKQAQNIIDKLTITPVRSNER